ncbi:MAG TPA: hypothetical protein PKN75_04380 [Bacteroidia bacterium]|nr:hypothetical protein [Bacteroidia bacterium]HNU32807.1 hypothetical protein [Bacteroidia bacterium]
MKKIIVIAVLSMQFVNAAAQKTINDYDIAYTIHLPDTTKDD